MAEKGFGVKEVNLIGASGTPTITSPNNLNLNAVNVAISTNVSIGGTLSVTGNISVGGTLTYEDVTNIDSVGIVTARDGVVVVGRGVSIAAGGLNVTAGVGTFAADIYANSGQIRKNGVVWLGKDGGDECTYTAGTSGGGGDNHLFRTFYGGSTQEIIRFDFGSKIGIAGANYGTSGQVLTSGGSGSAASWSDVSITPTNTDIQVVYNVTANGASAYRFAGNGVVSTADNPDLYLIRGKKYRFVNNSGGSHPFQIRESSGGTAYSTGVTNNGAASGNIDFAPTFDSPAQLVYQCTSHGGMVGNIYLRGAAGNENNVGVVTASSFESTTFSKTPTNTPAFHAYRDPSVSPSLSDATNTKITFLTDETLDTDNAYDNSSSGTTANRFTVPSGKGGYYNVSAGINFYGNNNDIRHARIFIQKNGNTAITAYGMVGNYFAGLRHFQCNLNGILQLAAGDYLELYAYVDVNGNAQAYISNDTNGLRGNHFSAFKLII